MKISIGSPVRKDNFLERPDDVRELWHCATRGHVVMLGPRRLGKTSILFRMVDVPEEGWTCLYLDVAYVDTEAHFIRRLREKLLEARPSGAFLAKLSSKAKAMFSRLKRASLGPVGVDLADAPKDDWQDRDSVLKLMSRPSQNTLIMIDEFPQFVRNLLNRGGGEAERFLNWFHHLRNSTVSSEFQVNFLLTGSISLDAVVQAAGLTKTMGLQSFRLKPLSKDLSRELLWRLSRGEGLPLSDEVIEAIVERIDWLVPYHLQLLFQEMWVSTRFKKGPADIATIDIAYGALLEADRMMYFNHWVERLEKTFSPRECALAKALLSDAARNPSGLSQAAVDQIRLEISPDTYTPNVLARLVHDGYLTEHESEGRWRFTATLLRDWWRKWQA